MKTEVKVKTYYVKQHLFGFTSAAQQFRADYQKMLREGWTLQAQSDSYGVLTATYVRTRQEEEGR